MSNSSEDVKNQFASSGWEHIILTGDYDWYSGAAERKIARPLHLNAAGKWVR
jgi:hypothetical protein